MTPPLIAEELERSWRRSRKPWGAFVDRLDKAKTPYLSHSKLTLHERCPRCYHRIYVLGQKEESEAMRLGTTFHHAANKFYETYPAGKLPTVPSLLKSIDKTGLSKDSIVLLRNGLEILRKNRWEGHEVVSSEDPFFFELASNLPPIIGVSDPILKRGDTWIVVDHKTSKSFNNHDPSQLVLYAANLRRAHDTSCVIGVYDNYKLVPDLTKLVKLPFRRIPVSVDRSLLPPLVKRYKKAWKSIRVMRLDRKPEPSPECWMCRSSGSSWY